MLGLQARKARCLSAINGQHSAVSGQPSEAELTSPDRVFCKPRFMLIILIFEF